MTSYMFRIAALSLAIIAGLAVPTIPESPSESAGHEVATPVDTLS